MKANIKLSKSNVAQKFFLYILVAVVIMRKILIHQASMIYTLEGSLKNTKITKKILIQK